MDLETFTDKYNLKLNKYQMAAVKEIYGPVMLLAVPGSGKTTVIVSRLGYMVYCCGIDPASILTMTYTVSATNDMRQRFRTFFGDEFADRLEFRTINGVCSTIINYYSRVMARQPFELVADEKNIAKILRELYIRISSGFPSESDIKDVRTQITYCKNMMLTDKEIEEVKLEGVNFSVIYKAYCKYMSEKKLMDYDDQGIIAYKILMKYPGIRKYFQIRYGFINVDEAQDTSKLQHMIIRLLTKEHRNIFMVGDEDQSIYGFRAAYPKALLEFEKVYKDAKVLLMETNYRSVGEIVSRANKFIKQNHKRHNKNMNFVRENGNKIIHTVLNDYNEQYNYILKLSKKQKTQTAVLFRNNDSAIPIIDLLEKKGVEYFCRQKESFFFSHYIVRDIVDFFNFAKHPWDSELFLNLYYKFDIKIKKEVIQEALIGKKKKERVLDKLIGFDDLENWQLYKFKAMAASFENILKDDAFTAVNKLVNVMGYGAYLNGRKADMSKVNIVLSLSKQNGTVPEFLARLTDLKNIIDSGSGKPDCKLILSTIHSSKGLEYDRVVLIDVVDGIFPSVLPAGNLPPEDLELLEEERRLFYVGVTRAKDSLELVTCKNRFGALNTSPSSFIQSFMDDRPKIESKPIAKPQTMYVHKPSKDISGIIKDYIPGTEVTHRAFGDGIIDSISGTICSVDFGNSVRKMDLSVCLRNNILWIRGAG